LASRQGFGELKTEQLGGHSQEQQRHRQAPIDDDDDDKHLVKWMRVKKIRRKSLLKMFLTEDEEINLHVKP